MIPCERHRIKIPGYGWLKLKEYGYIPYDRKSKLIRSGRIILGDDGHAFISVMADVPEPDPVPEDQWTEGIGVDVGLKDLAITSDGRKFGNVNKTDRLRRLEKRYKRLQRLSQRRRDALKSRTGESRIIDAKTKEGVTYKRLYDAESSVRKSYAKLTRIRVDHECKIVTSLLSGNPEFVTIEDLNVKGMMKNHYLADSLRKARLSSLVSRLIRKARSRGLEVRQVSRWYPSSKLCHYCGFRKKNLRLGDREWVCPACGTWHDRDVNAALNLRDAEDYKILNNVEA